MYDNDFLLKLPGYCIQNYKNKNGVELRHSECNAPKVFRSFFFAFSIHTCILLHFYRIKIFIYEGGVFSLPVQNLHDCFTTNIMVKF